MEGKFNILIVDDEKELAASLLDVLEAEGYSTVAAPDGETALAKLRENGFDMGIIDIRLPDMSGMDLTEKMTELAPGVEYIIITGYASLDTAIEAASRRPVVAYITKPLNMDHFLPLIRQLVERKRAEEELSQYREHLEELVEQRTRELRHAQEELLRKEKLAVLGQMAGGVGHELRNPLGVISNAVYYLQATLPQADETTRKYLEMIDSEVRGASKIITDLLDYARSGPAEREEIAVSDLVNQALRRYPPPQGVEVGAEIAPDLPLVFVDAAQIGQVLSNLISNAYQAMPEGGKLTISAGLAEGEPVGSRPSAVRISVSDTGTGISKENISKVFEPLFSTRTRGIGLGLAVSRNLVEANGGSITVQSQEGKGSTFTVVLPTREAKT